jgi:hypothetical protein
MARSINRSQRIKLFWEKLIALPCVARVLFFLAYFFVIILSLSPLQATFIFLTDYLFHLKEKWGLQILMFVVSFLLYLGLLAILALFLYYGRSK